MFALSVSKARFKSIIFYQSSPKIKLFLQKNAKFSSAGGSTPNPPASGGRGFRPQTQLSSGGWRLRPQTPETAPPPHCELLATRLIKPEILVNFRPEPHPKSPARLTTLSRKFSTVRDRACNIATSKLCLLDSYFYLYHFELYYLGDLCDMINV